MGRDQALDQQGLGHPGGREPRQGRIGQRRVSLVEAHRGRIHEPQRLRGLRRAQCFDVAQSGRVAAPYQQRLAESLGSGAVPGLLAERGQSIEDVGAPLGIEEAPRGDELEAGTVIPVLDAGARDQAIHAGLTEQQVPEVVRRVVHAEVFTTALPQSAMRTQQVGEPGGVHAQGPRRARDHQVPR